LRCQSAGSRRLQSGLSFSKSFHSPHEAARGWPFAVGPAALR
jgi:hypothetical protein